MRVMHGATIASGVTARGASPRSPPGEHAAAKVAAERHGDSGVTARCAA
jgi:hypothetical protein